MLETSLFVATLATLGMLSPGPDFFLIIRNAARYQRSAAMMTSLGVILGVATHMAYCVAGLAVLITTTPWLFNALKYTGAVYLIWIGIQALRSRGGGTLDLAVGGVQKIVTLKQFEPALAPFLERQAAQRTHEGDRLDALHSRIETALFGQVADQAADIVRAIMPEHPAHAFVGIDNAQQHAQGRGLARAIGSEHAVDRAFGDADVYAVDRAGPVKALDEAARFDCLGTFGNGNFPEIVRAHVFAYRHMHEAVR